MENFNFCAVFAQNGLKTFKNDLDKNYFNVKTSTSLLII